MATLHDVLVAQKLGAAKDLHTKMIAEYLSNSAAENAHELCGVPPLTFHSTGAPLLDYQIYGAEGGVGAAIPVTVSNETDSSTTNIQLDEPLRKISTYADMAEYSSQTVKRNINRLTLDGTETWRLYALNGTNTERFVLSLNKAGAIAQTTSNYFPYANNNADTEHCRLGGSGFSELYVFVTKSTASTVDELKTWLAERYANGEPVTVDYVLASPEAESVELPQIQTINGTNSIDVETAVKPSKLCVTYKVK